MKKNFTDSSVPHIPSRLAFLRRSLFLKLVLVYTGTMAVLMLTVGLIFQLTFDRPSLFETPLGKHLQKYVDSLADELGNPPQHEKARQLARELGVQIRVNTPQEEWATDASIPPTSVLTARAPTTTQPQRFGRYRDYFFALLVRQDTRYTFLFPREPFRRGNRRTLVWLIAVIGLILGGSYLVVRWLFRPLYWLNNGVQEIARGNFAYEAPVRSDDELGRLTASFNHMTTRVRQMVQAREQLLLDVSHELRSPLTRMKVALEFVKEPPVREQLQRDIRELETMVTELLDAERLSSTHGGLMKAEVDLVRLVRDVVDMYQGRQPGVQLVSAPATLRLPIDPDRLRIALRNVIDNALKASPATSLPVEIRVQRDTSVVRVSIRDYGPGIAAEDLTRVFEPFYRVDKSRGRDTGGYGLGLSLTKKIMLAHGGDILLVSEPGQGSTFMLQLPC
jgi:signal transduction histidine kinase